MRVLIRLAAILPLAMPLTVAFAQTTTAPATPATPAPAAPAPAPAASAPTMASPSSAGTSQASKHTRMTLQQRFDAANTTSDGHLTKEQASAAKWSYVSRHFDAIDHDHKGYVTVADIRAYAKAQRGARPHHMTPAKAAPDAGAPSTQAPAAPAAGSNSN